MKSFPTVTCSKLVKMHPDSRELEARRIHSDPSNNISLDEAGSVDGVPEAWVKHARKSGICGPKMISTILRGAMRKGLCQEKVHLRRPPAKGWMSYASLCRRVSSVQPPANRESGRSRKGLAWVSRARLTDLNWGLPVGS